MVWINALNSIKTLFNLFLDKWYKKDTNFIKIFTNFWHTFSSFLDRQKERAHRSFSSYAPAVKLSVKVLSTLCLYRFYLPDKSLSVKSRDVGNGFSLKIFVSLCCFFYSFYLFWKGAKIVVSSPDQPKKSGGDEKSSKPSGTVPFYYFLVCSIRKRKVGLV